MDFLEIRKKAQERAAARAAAVAPPSAPAASEVAPVPAPRAAADRPPPSLEPIVTAADVLEGQLAARLQGLPPAAGAAEGDHRFTTWRPGSDAPPALPSPDGAEPAHPDPADFTVVAPGEPGARRTRPAAPGRPSRDGAPRAARAAATLADFFYRPDEEAPAVELPGEHAAERSTTPSSKLDEFLTFWLGREEYGVPIELVRQVLKAPPITEVPRAPAHVVGVVTVRGDVVAVFDPRRRLGLEPAALLEGEGRIVLVDAGEGTYGLLVDAVAKVVRLPRGSVEPCPQGIRGASAECLAGVGREEGRLFTVLDLVALLRRAPTARRGAEGRRHADA